MVRRHMQVGDMGVVRWVGGRRRREWMGIGSRLISKRFSDMVGVKAVADMFIRSWIAELD